MHPDPCEACACCVGYHAKSCHAPCTQLAVLAWPIAALGPPCASKPPCVVQESGTRCPALEARHSALQGLLQPLSAKAAEVSCHWGHHDMPQHRTGITFGIPRATTRAAHEPHTGHKQTMAILVAHGRHGMHGVKYLALQVHANAMQVEEVALHAMGHVEPDVQSCPACDGPCGARCTELPCMRCSSHELLTILHQ